MADLSLYKVDLDTPQPDGRRGESPRSAFTKYNDALDALRGVVEHSGNTPPPNPLPYMQWIDTSVEPAMLRRRDADNTAWVEIGPAFQVLGSAASASLDDLLMKDGNLAGIDDVAQARSNLGLGWKDLPWLARAIGEPFPLRDDLAGVSAPPTNDSRFRYIKLTAGDPYNSGVLVNETVSGSYPLITATAQIQLSGSPLNGQTVHLINTERRIIRPGDPGALQDDAIQNLFGVINLHGQGVATPVSDVTGAFGPGIGNAGRFRDGGSQNTGADSFGAITLDASKTNRTSNETRMRNIGANFYMRIK